MVGTDHLRKGKVLPNSVGALCPECPISLVERPPAGSSWRKEEERIFMRQERGGDDIHEAFILSLMKKQKTLKPVSCDMQLPINSQVLCEGARAQDTEWAACQWA